MGRRHKLQCMGVFAGGAAGGGGKIAIGFGDDQEIGDLHDAALDALQFIPAAWHEQQKEHVHHIRHSGLGLADTHRFHQDDVEASRLAEQHRLSGAPGYSAQGFAGGRRADEGIRVARQLFHPRLVTQDRAAGALRGGIDGEDRHAVPLANHVLAERLDESGLADSRHAGDAKADRGAGVGQEGPPADRSQRRGDPRG